LSQTDAAAAAAESRARFERLLEEYPALAAGLPASFGPKAERWVALLLDANVSHNLTRVTAPSEVARLHLLDSLAALPLLDADPPLRALDLGTGGGAPGLPLALARPDVHWTLVDSVAKKVETVRGFVEALGLFTVAVLAERAETIGRNPDHRERYHLVTARACAPLPVLVEYALPLLRIGGRLLAWKGPITDADEELRRGRSAAGILGGEPVTVVDPGIAALGGHQFVVVVKARRTPADYPRRPGEPARRPLA
jgi:16S rRNA (guanine527-N7)-methyltransferase